MGVQLENGDLIDSKPRQREGITAAPIDDELALYAPSAGKAVLLNRTAAAIWELCDGEHTASAIAADLAEPAELSAKEIIGDVVSALKQFAELGLIEEIQ